MNAVSPATDDHPWRTLWRLALPVVAEEFGNMLVGYTDWWLAGRFLPGAQYQAAMGLLAYALWLVPTLFSFVGIGALALTARAIGGRDLESARRVTHQALLLGGAVSLVVMLLVILGARSFVGLMQLEPDAADLAVRYLRIIAPVIPFIMVEQVAAACLRAAGDSRSGFLAKTVVNVLNAVISTVLVAGFFGFPRLGWEGLAIGTAIGHAAGGGLLLVLLMRGRAGLQLQTRFFRPDVPVQRRLLRVGLPGGFDQLSVVAGHLTYLAVINHLGTQAAAAHGIGLRIEAFSFTFGNALAVAAASLAGQALGAIDERRAAADVRRACLAAMTIMSTAGTIYYFAGPQLTAFFNGGRSNEVTELAASLLKIVAWSCPFLAVLQVLTGGLRGAGDTRVPLLITFVGLVGIRIPLSALLAWPLVTLGPISIPGFDLGVAGAWIAMVSDVMIRSALVSWRFFHGGWRKVRV